jgi:hypothetical protein
MFGIFKTMAYFGPMKTLIIHPEDPTTTFLSQIYARLTDKTVINCGIPKSELRKLIDYHDRVLMLGHGSPLGLLNPGQFPDAGSYIIDDSMVSSLKNKTNSVFIWCDADQFVQRHGLTGLNSGMFISEEGEAIYYGFDDVEWDMINQSNERFAWIISMYLNEAMEILYQKLLYEYELIARTNPIARFNLARLYLTCSGTNKNPIKVVAI